MVRVLFTAAAEDDLAEAVDWYEARAPGLSTSLLFEVGAVVDRISADPRSFQVVHRDVRRALLKRFPYALFFRIGDDQIAVLACFHTGRKPRGWRART